MIPENHRRRVPAAVIAGLGAWLPPRKISNDQLANRLATSDEWIRRRTGIVQRHHVDQNMSTCDLATEAGRRALTAAADYSADALVLATTTPDRPCPGTAPEVASRLHLTGIAAFDVSAVCTGFLYGLATAAGLIAAGTAERVLLIGAETFTSIINPNDRATAVIFGDGAGAMVLRAGDPDEPGVVGPCVLGSDGEHCDLIRVVAGGSRQRATGLPGEPGDKFFQMDGRETYRHAVKRTVEAAREAIRRAGWTSNDVDKFVAHQANARIVNAVANRVGITEDRRLSNIDRVGNTAAASIPILLAESAATGALKPGDRTLLAGFGGGLTWGASTTRWPEVNSLVEPDPVQDRGDQGTFSDAQSF